MIKINLSDLKQETGVGFGSSGMRDLNERLTDKTVYLYTLSFLKQAKSVGELDSNNCVVIAGDRRVSTDKIMLSVARAIIDSGYEVINCGKIPTPAVVYFGLMNKMPSIMITGSHIPGDRNGVKFNFANREILKSDEESITAMEVEFDDKLFNKNGEFIEKYQLPAVDLSGYNLFLKRYLDFFGEDLLANKKIGVYGHSAVGRDLMVDLLTKMGAEVIKIDFSSGEFVPVDTDAVNEELIVRMKKWNDDYKLDHIISTDGDGDRPLLTDENGDFVRAEMMALLTARFFEAEGVATNITASTAVEKMNYFTKVVRTKVGSPYIIEAMINMQTFGLSRVVGYELNGGFLIQTDIVKNNKTLSTLPTRDALTTILGILALAREQKKGISQLVAELPKRFTYSLSIKGIPTERSMTILENWEIYREEIESVYGKIIEENFLDGLRLTFENQDVVHFRPSKNAPEFRNYTESATYDQARVLSEKAIELIREWTK